MGTNKEANMTYYEAHYGKCSQYPNGAPHCFGECHVCLGTNWIPMGPKTFDEMIEHIVKNDTKSKENINETDTNL
jgi:hypothetical protein